LKKKHVFWKPAALCFCWIILILRIYNKCELKTFKNIFSVLFLGWVTSSLYSWQSLASIHSLSRFYNLSIYIVILIFLILSPSPFPLFDTPLNYFFTIRYISYFLTSFMDNLSASYVNWMWRGAIGSKQVKGAWGPWFDSQQWMIILRMAFLETTSVLFLF